MNIKNINFSIEYIERILIIVYKEIKRVSTGNISLFPIVLYIITDI